MTRKRLCKLLMSKGVERNTAVVFAKLIKMNAHYIRKVYGEEEAKKYEMYSNEV